MTPQLIPTDFEAVDVSAGSTHCAAVDKNGRVYTWGKNKQLLNRGQLGHDTDDSVDLPKYIFNLPSNFNYYFLINLFIYLIRLVTTLENVQISSVSCGELNTFFFDKQNGQVWGCGTNEYGRLGIGPSWGQQDSLTPQLLGDSFSGEKVLQVSAGFNHTLVLTESGNVYGWGKND